MLFTLTKICRTCHTSLRWHESAADLMTGYQSSPNSCSVSLFFPLDCIITSHTQNKSLDAKTKQKKKTQLHIIQLHICAGRDSKVVPKLLHSWRALSVHADWTAQWTLCTKENKEEPHGGWPHSVVSFQYLTVDSSRETSKCVWRGHRVVYGDCYIHKWKRTPQLITQWSQTQ